MKTIEQVAGEKYISDLELPERKRMSADCYIDWANFGAREAQRWIPIEKEKPLATESGDWDGLRSDFVIAKDHHGNVFISRIYEGILDGFEFCDFVDNEDQVLSHIVEWRPIERK